MTRFVLFAAVVAVDCGSTSKCTISIETVSAETPGGQATLTGDFTQGEPIMILTTNNLPSFISCSVDSTLTIATCNIGGLVSPGTYDLSFHVACSNDADEGIVDNEAGDTFAVLY